MTQPADGRSTRRGRAEQRLDAATGRLLRLPPATTGYRVRRGLRVPMRDGVELAADHYAPERPVGTVLVRTPYRRSGPYALMFARLYAERGYHVVLQSTRGTFDSDEPLEPWVHEVEDGQDTAAWLRRQSWFSGSFATIGASYFGYTQWALLVDPPPELVAAVVMVGYTDPGRLAFGSGAFALADLLVWSDLLTSQEDHGPARALVHALTAERRLAPAYDVLPLAEAGQRALRGRAPWYAEWLAHPDPQDPYWRRRDVSAALDAVDVPVLLVAGWQDLFLDEDLEHYAALRRRGVDVALTVGPWTHAEVLSKGAGRVVRETLDWLGEHLAGTHGAPRARPVRVEVTGGGGWRELPDWPPPTTPLVLHLRPGGSLGDAAAPPSAAPASFEYHPADPSPTVGGRLLSNGMAGRRVQREREDRPDVLTFTGPPLPVALEVAGAPEVELRHRSSTPYADVHVRLCDVDQKGVSRNLSDGFVRLHTADRAQVVRLRLDPLAHRFSPGHRLRLQVSGGAHPRFARNLGTAEPPATATRMVPSRRAVGLSGSRLTLPTTLG